VFLVSFLKVEEMKSRRPVKSVFGQLFEGRRDEVS